MIIRDTLRLFYIIIFCSYFSLSHSRDDEEREEMIPILSESIAQESMSFTQTEGQELSFRTDEIILPFYNDIDTLPCEFWVEVMTWLPTSEAMNLSLVCRSSRQALTCLTVWKFIEEFVTIRRGLMSIVDSYPKLFSPESCKAFVWPEKTEEIVQQVAKIMRSGDEFIASIGDYLHSLEKTDFIQEDTRLGWTKETLDSGDFLQKLGMKLKDKKPFGVDIPSLLKANLSYPSTHSFNEEATHDLEFLLKRNNEMVDLQNIRTKYRRCETFFRNRLLIMGLSASAAAVCTGILYAYLDKFPAPLEPLHAWNNLTSSELWMAPRKKFPYISKDCFDIKYGTYHWDKSLPICNDSHSKVCKNITEILNYFVGKHPGLNIIGWRESIIESMSFRYLKQENPKGICTVDMDEKSLTCLNSKKLDSRRLLELTHIDGDCVQNRWLSSLIVLSLLSAETILFPIGMMIASFLWFPDFPAVSVVCFSFLLGQLFFGWMTSLILSFPA